MLIFLTTVIILLCISKCHHVHLNIDGKKHFKARYDAYICNPRLRRKRQEDGEFKASL
jgi:hypothetical protein